MDINNDKLQKRNYIALICEGTSFTGAATVISTSGAIALFINAMTGSRTLVGLAITIQSLFMIAGQLTGAPYVRSIKRLPETLFKAMCIERVIPFFMAIPLLFRLSGNTSVIIFLALFGFFWFFEGVLSVPWGELCARAVKPELRGHMMGVITATGGIASLLVGLFLTWLLATPVFDDYQRYATMFLFAGVIFLTSLIGMKFIRDPNPLEKTETPHTIRFYKQIPSIIRQNKSLQKILLARIPAFIGFFSLTFMVVFGVGTLDISEVQVSWLVYANIIGSLIGGILLGEASRRFGNKAVIIICNFMILITLGMAISLSFRPALGYAWLFSICALASFSLTSWIGYFNYVLDIAPKEIRSSFLVIDACIGIPFSFTGYAMGALIDNLGFNLVFYIGAFFSVIALLLNTRLMSKSQVRKLNTE